MRAFIAIELPSAIKDSLAKIQDDLKLDLPKINWVKPLNLHLSLRFLGEISGKQLDDIQRIIAEIVKTTHPFEIKLETLGVFPDYQAAKIIWIGTNQLPAELKQLVDQLGKRILEPRAPAEQRLFQAHITLGRIKYPIYHSELEKTLNRVKNEITDMDLKFDTRGITLYQSVLGQGGPTYSILKEAVF